MRSVIQAGFMVCLDDHETLPVSGRRVQITRTQASIWIVKRPSSGFRVQSAGTQGSGYRGTSPIRKPHPPRIAMRPYAEASCTFLVRVGFL